MFWGQAKWITKFRFWLYKKTSDWFHRLEQSVKEQRRQELQAIQYRLAEEMLAEFRAKKPIRDIEAQNNARKLRYAAQDKCSHRKGNFVGSLHGPHTPYVDYSVWAHRLPSGHWIGRCSRCGKPWDDSKADWPEFVKMLGQTSNRPSTSEYVFTEDERRNILTVR
jgi:hypothetical protein